MTLKLKLCLALVALRIGSAASSYTIHIPHSLQVGDAQLEAGEYELQVKGNRAIFKLGKSSIPVPVSVEKDKSTIRYTMIETVENQLFVIHVGGTDLKLVFSWEAPAMNRASSGQTTARR